MSPAASFRKKTPPVVFSRWGNKLVRLPQIALFLQILAQHCTVVDLILLLHHIIGRFYRCSDLHRLVELILLSYTRQPVDFIMHHFDVLQMADQFREFRRTPPLIEHIGAKSTIDVESVITMSSTNTYWHHSSEKDRFPSKKMPTLATMAKMHALGYWTLI